ncbi:hypothetical protein EV363DRAFT_1343478 [Boletus edulis]|nr:hypothetical protein EV363DRAFT_1354305 [Boletus edulis]KAF8128030.1 hypothetical protein EV363DRAFT_1343478 [Boletus edulis]
MVETVLTCSLCSFIIPRFLSQFQNWPLDLCCDLIQLANLLLKHIPFLRIAGIIVGLILFINARSFPLVWHISVLLPFGIVRCKYQILSLCHTLLLRPSATRHKAVVAQLESCCPVGANPFEFTATTRSWASPDETDWFGHVNNSTYAKARDAALAKFGLAAWPTFVNAGGWVTLASTHYHFLQEIPRFAGYEMNLSIGAWDHKWLYLVCRFTSLVPKQREDPASGKSKGSAILDQLTTIKESESGRSSDDDTTSTNPHSLPKDKSDGTTLHCFTVSRLCFKMGRITVPPAIVMACEGFSKPPETGSYSRRSPPPHWVHPHALRHASGSLDVYRRFLAGGWRDVVEDDRWWVEPLSGPTEERRRTNLTKLEVINRGVVGCLDIW